jgi:hypothetical protein
MGQNPWPFFRHHHGRLLRPAHGIRSILFYIAAPGRPLAKAKEKAKKECPPKKFHSAKTPFFSFNNQQIGPCQ